MKTLFFALLLFVCTLTSFAQDFSSARLYKPFKVDVAIGYAIPVNSDLKGGVVFAVEPKYSVLPQLSVGVRLEGVGISNGTNYNDVNNTIKVKATGSYLATGDYYFNNDDFRPFAGLGVGVFTPSDYRVTSDGNVYKDVAGGVKFGGMGRTGFEYKHFRLGLEYNMVANTSVDGYNVKNSYFSIKAGFTIGGGLIDNE
jgi:hypothetical protein